MYLHTRGMIVMSVLLLTALAAPASAAPPFDDGPLADDDAGSGGDAPESAAAALSISPGSHTGGFLAPDDRWDWYRVDEPGRFVHAVLDGSASCLWLEQDGRSLAVDCPRERGVSLWTFVRPDVPLHVGVERAAAEQYRLNVGIDGYAPSPRPAVGDQELGGRDVPDIPVALSVLSVDAPAQGRVGTSVGDAADWYLVPAPAGAEVTVTVVHVGLGCIRLLADDGGSDGSVCMVDPMQGQTVLQQRAEDAPLYLGLGGLAFGYTVQVAWDF